MGNVIPMKRLGLGHHESIKMPNLTAHPSPADITTETVPVDKKLAGRVPCIGCQRRPTKRIIVSNHGREITNLVLHHCENPYCMGHVTLIVEPMALNLIINNLDQY